jgi:hypothetical protein
MALPVRAMPPVRNPTYVYNDNDDFKATATPRHILEARPVAPKNVDPRTTAAGSVPPVHGLPAYVPFAAQTPYNVWALYPQ